MLSGLCKGSRFERSRVRFPESLLYFRYDLFGEGNITTQLKGIRKIVEGKKNGSRVTYACRPTVLGICT